MNLTGILNHLFDSYGPHKGALPGRKRGALVAKEAGVGAGTIYRYFENKEALINELFLEIKREISQAMLSGFPADATTEEQFRSVWLNTFEYCVQNPAEMVYCSAGRPCIRYIATAASASCGRVGFGR